jgi:hypothetical protein
VISWFQRSLSNWVNLCAAYALGEKKEAKAALEKGLALCKPHDGRAGGLGTFHHVILQSKHHFMTASMVHVTNLTPGSDNPSRAHGQKYQWMTASMVHVTASMVHVTNLTPWSDNPSRAYGPAHQSMTASMVR